MWCEKPSSFFSSTTTGVIPKFCFPSRDVEIILILAKVELASLLAQRSPVRVDEGFLRLVFRLTFQFVPLLKQRATTVIDGAGIGPHGLFFRRVAVFDLFDARLQRVIVIRFCLLYTSPRPRDATLSRMPSSA